MVVKIKYHSGDIEPIAKLSKGDWIDLRAGEDIFIPEGEFRLISLGVSMQLPKGYYAEVIPRSSTYKNFGIIMTNSMGIIDESYCGDNDIWRFPAFCLEGKEEYLGVKGTWIKKNDRICQFKIDKKMDPITFYTVESLGNADRGGFGSTGIR